MHFSKLKKDCRCSCGIFTHSHTSPISRSEISKSTVSLQKGSNSPAIGSTPELKKKDSAVFAMISGAGLSNIVFYNLYTYILKSIFFFLLFLIVFFALTFFKQIDAADVLW